MSNQTNNESHHNNLTNLNILKSLIDDIDDELTMASKHINICMTNIELFQTQRQLLKNAHKSITIFRLALNNIMDNPLTKNNVSINLYNIYVSLNIKYNTIRLKKDPNNIILDAINELRILLLNNKMPDLYIEQGINYDILNEVESIIRTKIL